MSNETQSAAAGEIATTGPIVAKAGRYYRVARYLMTLLLIAYGAWSIYDGFYSWPNWPITHPRKTQDRHRHRTQQNSRRRSPPCGHWRPRLGTL